MDVLKTIENIGVIPVVKIDDANKAVPLAEALIKGGLAAAEVTFRTAAAEQAIGDMVKQFPEMMVGAGTVLTIEQAEKAKNAGAKFIVSPGFNPKIVKWCIDNNIPVVPGCSTPSEIEAALELGLNVVKFFPAEQSGGLAKIKAMAGPYTSVRFMPTGGIDLSNLASYLKNKKIVACGGSFMVKADLINNDKWDEITAITKETVNTMLGFKIVHIGINSDTSDAAYRTGDMFKKALNCDITKDGAASIFVGDSIEIMKSAGKGKNGHIALGTNSVDRAVYHLSLKGISFDDESAKYNDDGTMKFIYMNDDFGGFKIHLIENK